MFKIFDFLGKARNDTPNLTACCMNVPNLILLKIGQLCSSIVQAVPKHRFVDLRQSAETTRQAKQKTCKRDVTVKNRFMFDIKFYFFFRLGLPVAYMS